MMKYSQILLGIIICILLEVILYNVNHTYKIFKPLVNTPVSSSSEKHQGGGNFTNPLLECIGVGDSDTTNQLNISKEGLNSIINQEKTKNKVSVMSVYVRDLNNGPWVAVNQNEDFIGGSLLKVPLLISYLKMADSDSSILQKVIEYKEKAVDNNQYYQSLKILEVGKKYTVEELLEYMIYYSDNNAAYLLSQNLDTTNFDAVFKALGFGDPDPNKPYSVNTVTYAGFFRVLFNASYLSKTNSEKALTMLSKLEFNRGLQAGLPNNIVVSHKFGIRSDGDLNQLHDCGIVYYPNHPYLICVMSRGGTFDNMAKSIADVSRFVYDQVSKMKNN
jgi:beta-lactamase class A